ncbi:MAG: DNA-processing protein DprA [Hyphomicrobium aestuarii]|nr:DNA-processing protein DprA [Hyphomicrobium aestuarii]
MAVRRREVGDSSSDLFTPAPLPVTRLDDGGRIACLRLIRSENVGPVTFRELINRYGSARAALEAIPEIARRAGRSRPLKVCATEVAEAELEAARKAGAEPIFTIEPGYPSALAAIEHPPPLLYVRGRLATLSAEMIAIVGSRECSANGITMAQVLAKGLGEAGYVIASGLARGIDGAAHRTALRSGTVAVLAGGIDHVYPPENRDLFQLIPDNGGAIVTDMPPGYQPRARDFPRRNGMISGMSRGVVVVEATVRSGGMVTARLATEQGREVFAVPGHPLDSRAEGPNRLIRNGATLITSAQDILDDLGPITGRDPVRVAEDRPPQYIAPARLPEVAASQPIGGDSAVNDAVLAALGPSPVHVDTLIRATGLPSRAVQIALMDLDLAGHIVRLGGQLVARKL